MPDCIHCAVEHQDGISPGCWWSGSADDVHARPDSRVNQQAEGLCSKEHILNPNFAAPLPYPEEYNNPDEEEHLNVDYALCQ